MIRRLSDKDQNAALVLLHGAPTLNLYMLGNIEKLGFDTDICEFWGDYEPIQGQGDFLRAVLNRYMNGWAIYGVERADWSALGGVVDTHPKTAARLQDNPVGVPSFLPFVNKYHAYKVVVEQLMELVAVDFRPVEPPAGFQVKRADMSDFAALVEFYADAEQMTRSRAAVERPLRDTRIWTARAGRTICSAALTNAEVAGMAMIGGVYTLPAQRGNALSQAVCSALCTDLLRSDMNPLLYWEAPAAGAVYRKLGFRPIGEWRSVRMKRFAGA